MEYILSSQQPITHGVGAFLTCSKEVEVGMSSQDPKPIVITPEGLDTRAKCATEGIRNRNKMETFV